MRLLGVVLVAGALLAGGCGGGEESLQQLQNGVYEFELTEAYLLENGIGTSMVESESGVHTTTVDDGEFVDHWRTDEGRTGACRGTYEPDGSRYVFRWTSGCFGDWAMRPEIEGDQVTWSDIEALDPNKSDEDQKITEVFNSVPWTRVGDAPDE